MTNKSDNLLKELDYSVLQQCMHCGMCLPTCPTYDETKLERHSPRGRIALMRAIADDELELTKAFGDEMYYCLGCLACVSACPAGVNYPSLFETARAEIERQSVMDHPKRDFLRWSILRVLFTRPRLLRLVGRMLWVWQSSGLQGLARRSGVMRLLPKNLRRLEPQSPTVKKRFSHQLIAPAESTAKPVRHVAVLTGCIQDIAFSDVNRATVDVLLANDCKVHTPTVQPCCGSLHAHNGDLDSARKLARRQLDLFNPDDYDAIISNAGGCGSHLKSYGHLLKDDPKYAELAARWDAKLKDIHEYLVEIDFRKPTCTQAKTTVAYHESCHLCHGQQVSAQPRAILRAIPGAKLVECEEAQWCCGSAGIYNITQPDTANRLQRRKIANILATDAQIVATANPGCHLQLVNGLKESVPTNPPIATPTVTHPILLLANAYREEAKRGQERSEI
ncbi:Lactate utilization protein A [Planctomycetes bacterium CA13]|uniref:Glycolate oxidase iron-sulfur subunit n=2 Tax=Novipirellula herctigrandis TaxID=2527986 RepID=A0A5C5Z599_9BACT|nr:Lactate utilization protein A [Planctomycetes bacterium CA13]